MNAKKQYLGTIGRYSEKIPFLGMKYPVTCLISKEYGNETRFETDKAARITTDEGSQIYLLKHANEAMPAVQYEHIYQTNTGGNLLFLHSPEKGTYNPVKLDINSENADMDVEQVYWNQWNRLRQMEERNAWETEKTWWERNQQAVIYATAGFFFLITGVGIWFALKDMSTAITQGASVMQSAAEALQSAR